MTCCKESSATRDIRVHPNSREGSIGLQGPGVHRRLPEPAGDSVSNSKLPDIMKREWLMYVSNPGNNVHPGNRFDRLLLFLEDQKSLLVRLEQLLPASHGLQTLQRDQATGRSQVTEGETRSHSQRRKQVKSKETPADTMRYVW